MLQFKKTQAVFSLIITEGDLKIKLQRFEKTIIFFVPDFLMNGLTTMALLSTI
jgi:hypothetical protein